MALNISISRQESPSRQIERQLRRMIESGALPHGHRLPPSVELARELGVHTLTLQKAMARLKAEGLLKRSPGIGTFVAKSATRPGIGLLISLPLSSETYFFRAMVRLFSSPEVNGGSPVRVYDGFSEAQTASQLPQTDVYRRLIMDVQEGRTAGLVSLSFHQEYCKRVAEMTQAPIAKFRTGGDGMDATIDYGHFARESVAYFARLGRQRIVYFRTMSHRDNDTEDKDAFHAAAKAFGIGSAKIEQFDIYAGELSPLDETSALHCCRQAIESWVAHGEWPDAIMISDDVIMRVLSAALMEARHDLPSDLAIVVYANKSVRLAYGLPVIRYELSNLELARVLMDTVKARMEGREPAAPPFRWRGRIVEANVQEDSAQDARRESVVKEAKEAVAVWAEGC